MKDNGPNKEKINRIMYPSCISCCSLYSYNICMSYWDNKQIKKLLKIDELIVI